MFLGEIMTRRQWFVRGLKAGVPICMGYFAVSLAIGIVARSAGLLPWQAGLTSLLVNASAGEYVGFSLIALNATYIEVILMEAVTNARYLLMSASMSQKLDEKTRWWERLLLGLAVTDEVFGVSMSLPGKLSPYFSLGAFSMATVGWTVGTFTGAVLGNVLPVRLLSALAIGLYGMFIFVYVPEARKNKVVAVLVAVCFAASYAFEKLPYLRDISSGIRTIILTVAISLAAALLFPLKEDVDDA